MKGCEVQCWEKRFRNVIVNLASSSVHKVLTLVLPFSFALAQLVYWPGPTTTGGVEAVQFDLFSVQFDALHWHCI